VEQIDEDLTRVEAPLTRRADDGEDPESTLRLGNRARAE
jgi:hypothetical protein